MDLFDDLPEPSRSDGGVAAAAVTGRLQTTTEEEERISKRKRADSEARPGEGEEEEEHGEIKKVCKEGLPVLKGYVAARRGEREEMQDAHVLLPDMTSCLPALPSQVCRASYFAVFDGHGGARASRFAADNLHHTLARKFPSGDSENLDKLIKKCLLDTFRQTDDDFLKKASSQKPAWKDGSTATCMLVVDDMVYVANLGDSRAVLCRMEQGGGGGEGGERRSVTLALSKEHNPTIYEERMRIQRAGGTVREGRVLGVLEVSRSIGDGQYKRCGVISSPDLRRCQLTHNDRFIILACDGLFKVFCADEAVKYVLNILQDDSVERREGLTEEEGRFEAACQRLASEAVRRGCADNVTVILVSIGHHHYVTFLRVILAKICHFGQTLNIKTSENNLHCYKYKPLSLVIYIYTDMESFLDFEDCIKDSPSFRLTLEQFETDVTQLESQVEKVMKLCGKMVEAGQVYNSTNQLFVAGLAEFSMYHKKDSIIMNCLNQFNQGLQEMVNFHTMLFDQTQRAINQQLTNLFTQFLPQLAETRREFVRIGEDLETAAMKNAQISRHKTSDAERASHLLLATRKCHQHFALDYCLQLNNFKTQQKIDILNSVFSHFHAQYTFFHQGFDLLRDLEPTMKTMATQLAQLSAECAAKRKDLENTHLLVQQRDASGEPIVSCPSNDDIIQGYLFKRSRRKSKTWKRCWFSIKDNQLIYRKSHKEDPLVLFEDLRLCAIKSLDHIDRRFCFELLSVQKCCALQADSEELKQAWVNALQGSIDMAYRERVESQQPQPKDPPQSMSGGDPQPGPPSQRPPALGTALQGPGNQRCCDCGEEEPRWASINLGITVCIECSGIHRSLGVHLSKVRSLTLDSWDSEQLKLLCVLGNDVVNRIYEARCSEEGRMKPCHDSPRPEKETWIKEKYVEKRFVARTRADGLQRGKEAAGRGLYRAALLGDLVAMAAALAQGAEVNVSLPDKENRTALIGAAVGGSLLACEFLLLNGANVNHRDHRGQGALHHAATAGHTGQVCLLLKRGANQYAADERGQDPLAIAVETAHADIVTLLRMARMNEEMRDSEGLFGSMGDDETFQDIFRDFSDMASHDPERLTRRHFSRGGEEEEEEEEGGRGGGGEEEEEGEGGEGGGATMVNSQHDERKTLE
ncbi:arf-GAP with coiled-coil, ANK repeat and PH domain-containing protein 2 [Polymixia lowei]